MLSCLVKINRSAGPTDHRYIMELRLNMQPGMLNKPLYTPYLKTLAQIIKNQNF